MNGLYLMQLGNGFYTLQLPNGLIIGNIVLPNDNNDSLDFDIIFNVSKLISTRCDIIEGDIKELKQMKLPNDIRVIKGNGSYSIYLNGNMQVAEIAIPVDIISSKVIVGISILLEKRWRGYIKQQTALSNMNSFAINNRVR